MSEGEEEEKETENSFERIMKENFLNLTKEIGFQEVPRKLDSRKHTPQHIIITLPKIKDKERILKAAREKETVTYKVVPKDYQLISQKKPYRQEGAGKKYFKVMKGKDLHPRLLSPAKLSFRMEGQIECFPDKVKVKEFIITKPFEYEMLKGLI